MLASSSRQHFEPRERRVGRAASRFSWWLICDESRRLAGDTTQEVPASCLLPQKSGARLLRSFVHPRVRRQPGRCLLRPAAQTRLSPTTRSRKSLVARTASAWPALLVQRGSFRDRRTAFGNGTAYRCGAFKAARIAVHRSKYSDFPHPRIHEMNGLLSAWFPTFVKRPAVCLRSNRPPAKRNTAHQRIIGRRRVR